MSKATFNTNFRANQKANKNHIENIVRHSNETKRRREAKDAVKK